jgi:cytochrome P450
MRKRVDEIPRMRNAQEHFRIMRTDRIGGLRQFNRDNGDVGHFRFLFGTIVLANSPELVHDVLVARARSFEKSPVVRAALHPLVGDGLFTSEGELWRRQRKLMAPLFPPAAIAGFADDMTAATRRVTAGWRDGAAVDVAAAATRITMTVAGKTLFDADTFSEADELGEALTVALAWAGEAGGRIELIAQARASIGVRLLAERLPRAAAAPLHRLARRLTVPILWPGARSRALKQAIALLDARVARMIAERRASAAGRHDLLSLLLGARDEDTGAAMPDRQVRDEVLTLFVAGHETTATGLAWALWLLARHPAIYRALRAEVDAIERAPTADDVRRLPLALRVFKEALRLYPPVYIFGRVAIADVQVGPYLLPNGTVVLISPWALHHRAEIYPDPERFDPDRFLPAAEAARHRSAYIPFSAGPRTCIGNHFALMEGPLVLAQILRDWDLELIPGREEVELDPQATLRPKGGIALRVRRRATA